jgi:DNA repair protein RadC
MDLIVNDQWKSNAMTPPQSHADNTPEENQQISQQNWRSPAVLSTTELIAALLDGSDRDRSLHLAANLLEQFGGLHELAQATAAQRERITDLNQDELMRLGAAFELGQRLAIAPQDTYPTIRTAADAAQLVLDMGNLRQEHIRVILLDTSRRVISIHTVYIGTVSAAVLRASEIYREAITNNAPAIIMAHNHPSGDPSPSPEDVELTVRLISAGEILDITLLDHLIIGRRSWCSLREMGLAF